MNPAHALLEQQLKTANLWQGWVKEHKFHPTRKWRLDFAHPSTKVAIEIHGGVHTQGRHTRGQGFIKDREKMTEAQLLGWLVIEAPTEWITRGTEALELARRALREREGEA